jgi:hypothetical protein
MTTKTISSMTSNSLNTIATNNKRQLLDPIGSICHIVSLTFKPLNTKIGINNHAIIIQETHIFQWLDRYWNGDNRENISLLYNIVVRVIEWYILPLSGKYEIDKNDDFDEAERKKFWECLEKMCNFLCVAFDKLQHTYYTGPIPTNVVTTIQYYINLLQDSLNGNYNNNKLPKCLNESENKNFFDYDKIKVLWNGDKLKQICDLYEKCFEKLNSTDRTKEDQIEGYMQAVDKLLSIHDNQFRELICFSNEG